ncbi:MAG: hypothetical protein WCK17_19365 [Verrucomicrobiota bacterium]
MKFHFLLPLLAPLIWLPLQQPQLLQQQHQQQASSGIFWRSLLHWHPSLSIIFKEIILMQYGINKRLVKIEQAVYMVRQQHTDCSFPCVCLGRALDTSAIIK